MKKTTNMKSIFLAILLIVAATLSPSNGLDERINKTPLELISTMLVIVSAGFAFYFSWNWVAKRRELLKTIYMSNDENARASNK